MTQALGYSRPLIDARTLLATCGDDPQLLRELLDDLQTLGPGFLATVVNAWQVQDARCLRETAHRFCGLLSAFSAEIGQLLGELEQLAGDNQLDLAAPLVTKLDSEMRSLIRQVDLVSLAGLRAQVNSGLRRDGGSA